MKLSTLRSAGIASALVIALGCGGSRRDGFDDDNTKQATDPTNPSNGQGSSGFGGNTDDGIELDPKNATIVIDSAPNPAVPATLTYKITSHGKDATQTAKLEIADPSLGSFAGPTLTTGTTLPGNKLGVSTTVKATTADGTGAARLTVLRLHKTGPQRDFFFVVPYQQDPSPKSDVLEFSPNIKQVDVAFSMDTTGSMGGSIANLKTALSGTLLTQLQAAIPDVGLAIVDQRDYPTGGFGMAGDWPVKVRQTVTTTLSSAQAAVNQYAAGGGGDGPEAQIPSMQHILTGEALAWSGGSVPAVTPTPGHFGAVDFRPGSVPVIVNITDVNWHGENNSPYSFSTPTMATLKTAFTSKNAFFVDVTSGPEAQAEELSDATKSNVPPAAFGGTCGAGQCCTGVNGAARPPTGPGGTCRLNFLHSNGTGVSAGVVKAIEAISTGAAYDMKAVASNDPTNPNGVDAVKFIHALRAMDEGSPTAGCPAGTAKDSDGDGIKDTFVNITVGTKLCFEVIPAKNGSVAPTDDAQFYNAFVDIIGVQGNVQLDRRRVLFLVPPKDVGVN